MRPCGGFGVRMPSCTFIPDNLGLQTPLRRACQPDAPRDSKCSSKRDTPRVLPHGVAWIRAAPTEQPLLAGFGRQIRRLPSVIKVGYASVAQDNKSESVLGRFGCNQSHEGGHMIHKLLRICLYTPLTVNWRRQGRCR